MNGSILYEMKTERSPRVVHVCYVKSISRRRYRFAELTLSSVWVASRIAGEFLNSGTVLKAPLTLDISIIQHVLCARVTLDQPLSSIAASGPNEVV
jgi:hypothetical protein